MSNISYEAVARLIAEAQSRERIDLTKQALTRLTQDFVDYAETARHDLDAAEFLAAAR